METKTCSKCHETLPVERFGKNPKTKDKYKVWCKPCTTTYMRNYRESKPELRQKEREYALNYWHEHRYDVKPSNEVLSN